MILHGTPGAGKETAAAALCRELEVPLLVVDLGKLVNVDLTFDTAIRLICREAFLNSAALYLAQCESLLVDGDKLRQGLDRLLIEFELFPGFVFLGSERAWQPARSVDNQTVIGIELPVPSNRLRRQLWEACFDGGASGDLDFGALADKFRFTPGQIQAAARTARDLARLRDPDHVQIAADDLCTACRAHSNQKLAALAHKISPRATRDQIVLPPDQLNQLSEIVSAVKCHSVVYGDWGFDRRLSLGKGLNILFSGPPGTGKTMAAEIIAGELGLDLYKIDLSQVVSKYIGETEKNLDRIFTEAETSNAILFFDEADALFGKRSEVKDAHDRYANIEIGYLLQKAEEYDGIAILATNVREHMDQAFVRRMHVIVEFPFPDEEDRRRIWEVIFPREAPCGEDVDLEELARQVRLPGGNISNIALAAALYAAADGRVIRMPHLLTAAHREYQKLGRSWPERSRST